MKPRWLLNSKYAYIYYMRYFFMNKSTFDKLQCYQFSMNRCNVILKIDLKYFLCVALYTLFDNFTAIVVVRVISKTVFVRRQTITVLHLICWSTRFRRSRRSV